MRLLLCRVCQEIDELPSFEGEPWNDALLNDLVNRHLERGGHEGEDVANLFDIEDRQWLNPDARKEIIQKMKGDVAGFEPEFYATKSTYVEDAGKCFNNHRRTIPCVDWHSQSKRIGNPVKEQFKNPAAAVYLCDFCVVRSHVETEVRHEAGLYDKHPGEPD